jgi:hypothetical protein
MAKPLHHFLVALKFCECGVEGQKGNGVQGSTSAKKALVPSAILQAPTQLLSYVYFNPCFEKSSM